MRIFEAMGAELADRWAAAGRDERVFPGLAARVLADAPGLADVTPDDLVDWALASPRLPPQLDPRSTFGEPPITLHTGPGFVIDAYFWLDGATAVHQHGFAGAFRILAGSSLHVESRWTTVEQVEPGFSLGSLQPVQAELLARGDVREICTGDAFIHAQVHLDRPSCSLVVRTHGDALARQFTYLPPGVAHDAARVDPTAARKREVLTLLRRSGDPTWRTRARRLLSECDLSLAFHVLLDALRHTRSLAAVDDLLAAARTRHGARVDALVPTLAESVRQRALLDLRARVRAPDHRLLLGLLLHLPDAASIAAVVRRRCPESAATVTLHRWVGELAAQWRQAGLTRPFGAPLGASDLAVLGDLLDGLSDGEVVDRRLPTDASAAEMAGVLARCHALRSSLLAPLFA